MIKVLGFAEFQYLYFSWIFYAFLNEPGCSVMSACCPDNNLNCFHWISIFFGICITWVNWDLGWDRRWASYLIKYAHNGWSCDFGIFGIPGVNFSVRAFKLGMLRDLKGTCDIISRFCQIPICSLSIVRRVEHGIYKYPFLTSLEENCQLVFSCDQAALITLISVRPSVRPSVPSVRPVRPSVPPVPSVRPSILTKHHSCG